jgi:hypothetical protein
MHTERDAARVSCSRARASEMRRAAPRPAGLTRSRGPQSGENLPWHGGQTIQASGSGARVRRSPGMVALTGQASGRDPQDDRAGRSLRPSAGEKVTRSLGSTPTPCSSSLSSETLEARLPARLKVFVRRFLCARRYPRCQDSHVSWKHDHNGRQQRALRPSEQAWRDGRSERGGCGGCARRPRRV